MPNLIVASFVMTHDILEIFHRHTTISFLTIYTEESFSNSKLFSIVFLSLRPVYIILSLFLNIEDRDMGSLEEDQLVQMVQDFMESESPSSPTNSTSSKSRALNHRTQCFILQDILRSETIAEAKVRNYVSKHMRGRRDAEKTSSLRKWLVMRLKMDGLNASLCHTSWATSLGCPAGEYEYIEVNITDDQNGNSVRLIVDIDFKSQFELARPTQHYIDLMDSLPVIFIGTENKLCKIISLLCSAAKQSLRKKGLYVPPWRTTSYMQSKWLSGCQCHHKEPCREGVGVREAEGDGEIGKWVPPIVKSRRRDLGGESGLSNQFSDMTINCC